MLRFVLASGATRLVLAVILLGGCGRTETPSSVSQPHPSILLVTLDTTRADAMGPEALGVSTPAFDAIAARGRWFRQAYATAPETLPSHASMMTGLYPAGHGVHENARRLADAHPIVTERLKQAGYATGAFVSSFVLARQFGLARGFDVYDDQLETVERSSRETTDRALAFLQQPRADAPTFLWVHYFDPHAPYAPPAPFRPSASAPRRAAYLGEIAAVDANLGRLLQAFEREAASRGRPYAVVIAADHGEGLGDHGEATHGHLLYQSTMHVPLVIAGPGVAPGVIETPVSIRQVFDTLLDFAGMGGERSLRGEVTDDVVLGEAMKPYLEYGWQPQIMAVQGMRKAILAGRTEVFDLASDPGETRNLAAGGNIPAPIRAALDDYPVPTPGAPAPRELSQEAQRSLASLGYVGATAAPVIRPNAPRPADMMPVLDLIERASTLFVRDQFAQAIPVLRDILARDPFNLDATLRLATAYSSLGRQAQADAMFRQAAVLAPRSADVRLYRALHLARTDDWGRAIPILQELLRELPDRVVAAETLGRLAMRAGETTAAIQAFERARQLVGAERFAHHLELGVLYLSARRLDDARRALDRVPASHSEYPMALFKRAQVSVLLGESDRARHIARARQHADHTTRDLIARERLFVQ